MAEGWQNQLYDLLQRVKRLESSANFDTSEQGSTTRPTSDEFLKLCNRVDLLDGKINLMKTTLDELLQQMRLESRILDKSFHHSSKKFEKRIKEKRKTVNKQCRAVISSIPSNEEGDNEYTATDDFCADDLDFVEGETEANWLYPVSEEEDLASGEAGVDVKPDVNSSAEEENEELTNKHEGDDRNRNPMDNDFANDSELGGGDAQMIPLSSSTANPPWTRSKNSVLGEKATDRKPRPSKIDYSAGKSAGSHSECPPLGDIRRNPQTKLYHCPTCYKTFKERNKFFRHYVIHSGERPFVCTLCEKDYTRKDKLTDHYRIEHHDNIPQEYIVSEKKGEKLPPYICPDCGRMSANKSNHESHLNACRGNKPFVCPVCERGFTQKSSLNTHVNCVHEKLRRFLCNDCGKSFSISTSYQRHLRMHRGMTQDPYHYMNKARQAAFLSLVIRTMGEKPFPCKYCQKPFGDKSDLRRHELCHLGIKNFKCDLCERTFSKPSAMRRHMKTHSGDRPFMCDECGATFTLSYSLKKHKLLHAQGITIRKRAVEKLRKQRSSKLLLSSENSITGGSTLNKSDSIADFSVLPS